MTPPHPPHDLEHYRRRRARRARQRRVLNNLPLAHRLACERAGAVGDGLAEYLLGQAVVGLIEAADRFDAAGEDVAGFRSLAEAEIQAAMDRRRDEAAVEEAQAELAAAIADQERVHQLAGFLGVPVEALVGGLVDAAAGNPAITRPEPILGAA